jgi:hypothetical protein
MVQMEGKSKPIWSWAYMYMYIYLAIREVLSMYSCMILASSLAPFQELLPVSGSW